MKSNEYDVGPLYWLISECVTVLISNLEQMRMCIYKDDRNLSGDNYLAALDNKWRSPDEIFFLPGTNRFPYLHVLRTGGSRRRGSESAS